MSSIQIQIHSSLARAAQLTARLKERRVRWSILAPLLAAIDLVVRGVFYLWRNHQYLTLPKLANMVGANVCFLLKTERVVARPYRMKIESTNICNTKCQLCPTGIGLTGRPKGKMDYRQYRGLIDQVKWHLLSLDLSMWGDPLIVPEIYDMVRYAHDRRIWTYISSNLHAFKPDKGQAEQLIESGLDMLTCSLHGASQATYEAYQPGKSFDQAVDKVRHILETRRRLGSTTPAVQLNFVVTRRNEHERHAFGKLAEELGCGAVFSTASMNIRFIGLDKKLKPLGLTPEARLEKTLEHLKQWLPEDPSFVLEPYRKLLEGDRSVEDFNGRKLMNCSWPWRSSVVNWDGEVAVCCGGFDPAEDMGNVLEQPFAKVWNGQRYRMARRTFKQRVSAEQAADNPCATCPGFML